MSRRARGFSLIEMAFVLIIVTLLLGGLLVPFATQVEQKRIGETQKAMEEIKEALLGFAIANGRLPCPDIVAGSNDGLENSPCPAASEGNLPWATLGVGNQDAWGNRFYYRVTDGFAAAFVLGGNGSIDVCTAGDCPAMIASNVPVVVVSYGKNGYGAISSNSAGASNIAPTSPDELANQPGDNIFVSRPLTQPGAPAGEFDDLVTWISPNVLFNRMVAAGRLP